MPTVTADSYGIDFTGTTDVTAALAAAINAQPSGNTFQFHAGGKYLTSGIQGNVWTPTGVIIDGQGATLFRNIRRSGDTATNDPDIIDFNAPGSTLKNLNVYGFRKDTYTGDKLTTVAGSPTVSGTGVILDAQNEEVRVPNYPLDYFLNPLINAFTNSEIPFYFRYGLDGLLHFEAVLADTTHVPNDCVFSLIDDSTNAVLASSTLTLGATPATYSLTFDPIGHLGRRMRVHVKKATATANQITVVSMTPWNTAGFRLRGIPAPNTWTGGNEFCDGIATTGANVTFDNVWIEGPDGDGINLTSAGVNCQVINCTARATGRHGFTIEFSTDTNMVGCMSREAGRAGIDQEPNGNTGTNHGWTLTDHTFLNCRNYAISTNKFAQCFDATFTNLTSTNCGMGAIFGGGTRLTINGWTHTGTYRTEADRLANGAGSPTASGHAYYDFLLWGIDVAADDITTDFGFYIPDKGATYNPGSGNVVYHPDNVDITNGRVMMPTTTPPYLIDATVPNSSIQLLLSGSGEVTWDSSAVDWDDPVSPWDGGGAVAILPAFQSTAFQNDAFQTNSGVFGGIGQTMPSFTQSVTGRVVDVGGTIEQEIAAFTQTLVATVQVTTEPITQTIAAFTQDAAATLTVRGAIGERRQTFQVDAFQNDAYQITANVGVTLPAFTQHLSGGVLSHLSLFGVIHQTMPAFTQTLTSADLQITGTISQTIAAFTQSLTGMQAPAGAIEQEMPAFAQAVLGFITVNAIGTIHQTMPAFTQSLRATEVSWDEWDVVSNGEWPVHVTDEWLVRH